MAKVELSRDDAEDGRLPEVCMKCGAQSWKQKSRTFSWYPPWVGVLILGGILPFVIVAAVLTKRMTVRVPLCDEHQNHWSWRGWFIGVGAILMLMLGLGCFAVLVATDQPQQRGGGGANPLAGVLCAGGGVAFLIFIITAAIIQQLAIRPTEITNEAITLTNVAPEFSEAVEEAYDRYERDRRERRPQRRQWEEDDRPRDRGDRYRDRDDRYRDRDDRYRDRDDR
jgi:hypothetical protein